MELQERINVLTQSAELAQKNGALTLDEAYYAKQAIDVLKNDVTAKPAYEILIKIANLAQKKGVFSLKDACFIYLAIENIESAIPAPAPVQQAPQSVTAPPVSAEKKVTRTKKES